MEAYNPKTIEQKKTLKDGRVIHKTHNGFKCWVTRKNGGEPSEVSQEYYTKVKANSV
jgi:hypothetical protein